MLHWQQAVFIPDSDRSGLESGSTDRGLTVWWCHVNNIAITNIHSPVLIVISKDLNQVPRLWFLIRLGLEETGNMFDFATDCLETTAVHLRTLTWSWIIEVINKADNIELNCLHWLNKCSIYTCSRWQYANVKLICRWTTDKDKEEADNEYAYEDAN